MTRYPSNSAAEAAARRYTANVANSGTRAQAERRKCPVTGDYQIVVALTGSQGDFVGYL